MGVGRGDVLNWIKQLVFLMGCKSINIGPAHTGIKHVCSLSFCLSPYSQRAYSTKKKSRHKSKPAYHWKFCYAWALLSLPLAVGIRDGSWLSIWIHGFQFKLRKIFRYLNSWFFYGIGRIYTLNLTWFIF